MVEKTTINYDWHKDANCRGLNPDYFYPEKGQVIEPMIIELCKNCPVKTECLNHALKYEQYGFWAGTSEKKRKTMRVQKRMHLHKPESQMWRENSTIGSRRASITK